MDGFSLVIAVCRVTSIAVAAVAAGLALAQVTQSWRADGDSPGAAPGVALVSGADPVASAAAAAEGPSAGAQPVDTSTWLIAVERQGAAPEFRPSEGSPIGAASLGPPADPAEMAQAALQPAQGPAQGPAQEPAQENGPAIAVERLGPLPPLAGDPGSGDGIIESTESGRAPPVASLPAQALQMRRTPAAPTARPAGAAKRVSVAAAPPASRSGWWPSWLRWPAHGSRDRGR